MTLTLTLLLYPVASKLREGGDPFHLVRPHLEYCIQFWTPQDEREMAILGRVQQRTMKIIKGLVNLSYEESLRELELASLEEGTIGESSSMCTNTWREDVKKTQQTLFSDAQWRGRRTWTQAEIQLNIRECSFTMRVTKNWKRLPGEVVESHALAIFKSHLGIES